MKRKICVVTGTRAEYGLLYWLMKGIQHNKSLELQIIATGTHLSPEFGLTYKEIENDGFSIDKKIEMILSADTPSAIAKSTGLCMIGFSDAFIDLKPDLMIVLGDRYELLATAFSAFLARIPVVHISGGETTIGAVDEAIRHSITKMAWWHFVATKDYEKRVIQLGENPERIFLVGGLGVDAIVKADLLNKKELEKRIKFTFGKKNLLVTFHPVTLEKETSEQQCAELLSSLGRLSNTCIIFTAPNADTEGRVIKKMINEYVSNHQKTSIFIDSMGQLNYMSALKYVDAMVGNSSSGIVEAPTLKIGTINIGDRQKGRVRASSIIDCDPTLTSINKAFEQLYSNKFQSNLKNVVNPYGNGLATEKIIKILKDSIIPKEIKKEFYDL